MDFDWEDNRKREIGNKPAESRPSGFQWRDTRKSPFIESPLISPEESAMLTIYGDDSENKRLVLPRPDSDSVDRVLAKDIPLHIHQRLVTAAEKFGRRNLSRFFHITPGF